MANEAVAGKYEYEFTVLHKTMGSCSLRQGAIVQRITLTVACMADSDGPDLEAEKGARS